MSKKEESLYAPSRAVENELIYVEGIFYSGSLPAPLHWCSSEPPPHGKVLYIMLAWQWVCP
jgi:hypothetical protein